MSSVHIYCLLSFLLYSGVEGKDPDSKVIAGSSLEGTTIQAFSSHGSHRSATIEIVNTLDKDLHGGEYYMSSGQSIFPPLTTIRSHHREAFLFDKYGSTATGTIGVFTYTIANENIRFAFVFIVPFDYIWYSNWFGLKFVSTDTSVNQALYNEMYSGSRSDQERQYGYASAGQPLIIKKGGYKVTATMSNSGRSIIRIEVSRAY